MLRLRHGFALSLLAASPFALLGACGDGEDVQAHNQPVPDSGADAPTNDVVDSGVDKGPFGDRVPVTATQGLTGLTGPVNAVRDKHGWMHIYARNKPDLFRVQGFMMASDRGAQLEIARRLATGRLAEVFGAADPGQIDSDITMRTIGLGRVAKQIYDALDPSSETKAILDAFADGVTQWNKGYRDGKLAAPQDLAGFPPSVFSDWSPVDSLALARLQTWLLSYDADSDIDRSSTVEKVRAEFNASSADPLAQKRAGILVDSFRFDPLYPNLSFPIDNFPNDPLQKSFSPGGGTSAKASKPAASALAKKSHPASVDVAKGVLDATHPFIQTVRRIRDLFTGDATFGSNNWAVAKAETDSGNAMVASDPHLGLSSPMVFWPTHLVMQSDDSKPAELEVIGMAFPGIPGVVLGANRYLGWGATTAGYDVTDVWKETVTADGSGVTFKGQPVAFQKITETMKIAGSPDYTWDILVVPEHGPVVPEIDSNHQVKPVTAGGTALSVHWTGHQRSGEFEAVTALATAKTVDDARLALQPFATGSQNWMFADSNGDIFWFAQAQLPYRDKKAYTWDPATFSGTMPCFILDGASGDQEWTGAFLEEQYVPKLKDPQKGWIATANTDQIGSTKDNDPTNDLLPNGQPFYIGCDFEEGNRLGRIQERLESTLASGKMSVDGMASIQNDHKSGLGSRLGKYLVAALQAAEAEKTTPGTHPSLATVVADPRYAAADVADILDTLAKWETDSQFEALPGINLDDNSLNVDAKEATAAKATVIFNAWLIRAIARALGDEMDAAGVGSLGSTNMVKGFVRMLEQDPTKLATYDSATGESALWDDMSTPGVVETRDDRLVTALLDALDDLDKLFASSDRNTWRWGALHRVTFKGLNPLWLVDIPGFKDPTFAKGFPRPGDQWNVDAANFGIWKSLKSPLDFGYGSGPVQRFVAEMTPAGPKIKNALPGGAVLGTDSPFFRNEAEYWRKNQNHDVPFEIGDVQAAAVSPGGANILFGPG